MVKSHNLIMNFIALDAFLKTSVCIHMQRSSCLLLLKGMCGFLGGVEQL